MRVLFISEGRNVDYQCDCLFHGLNCLESVTVYTANDYWFMFDGNPESELRKLYGMGFSIANRIPSSKRHTQGPEEIRDSIAAHYYDAVVYGSVFRCQDYLPEALRHYRRQELVFIDGEDNTLNPAIIKRLGGRVPLPKLFFADRSQAMPLAKRGLYFKRELLEKDRRHFFPISFAIPEDSVVGEVPQKTQDMAFIYPGDKKTYIYKTEADYYKGYQVARFGTTFKKAGWDCMRHYEILANGCIPYFPDIDSCPRTTMANFPKGIIRETNKLFEMKQVGETTYEYYSKFLLTYTREILTTGKLAENVLSFAL